MACAGGFRSVSRNKVFSISFSRAAAPASAILSWRAARCTLAAAAEERERERARSQRTIKKSTKNKLRSAYPSPFRARTLPFLAQGELYSLPSACCNLSRPCVGANVALLHPLFPSLSGPVTPPLSLSLFSFSLFLHRALFPRSSPPPRGPTAAPLLFPLFLVVCLG